jgi:hypothetical protein
MRKLAVFLGIWLFSSAFSYAGESRVGCTAVCAKDYETAIPSDCVRAGRECEILCRNAAIVDVIKGKCVRTH